MADYTARYGKPQQHTFQAGATIAGGDVLVISGINTVSPSAAGPANYAGIAAHDAVLGAPVTVLCGSGVIHETPIGAGVAAGALLYAGAGGQIGGVAGALYGAVAIGVAVNTVAGAGVQRWKSLIG